MITITREDNICKCSHKNSEHGSSGRCFKTINKKERKRGNDGKYKTFETHWQCCCEKVEEDKNE